MPPESISLLGWRYLMESAPLLLLRLNWEGEVMEANAFTRGLLLGGMNTLDDVFFLLPDRWISMPCAQNRTESA